MSQMDADDYESTLCLLADMHELIADDRITALDRLDPVDAALEEVIGGLPEKAHDRVRKTLARAGG